jgi:hypothetical protein
MHPLQTHLEQSDAKPLRALLSGLSSETDNRLDLALRRFNRAYERYSSEDSLIDLWVAFEALLVPDGSQELRYRASLRIARFAAQTSVERKRVFRLARDSYDVRSKVVHGSSVPDGLDKTVEQTRQLARKVLQAWVLNPPQNGVSDIDDALLA